MMVSGNRAVDARRGSEVIDPYMAGKMADYNRDEIARSRGLRNWKRLFSR